MYFDDVLVALLFVKYGAAVYGYGNSIFGYFASWYNEIRFIYGFLFAFLFLFVKIFMTC